MPKQIDPIIECAREIAASEICCVGTFAWRAQVVEKVLRKWFGAKMPAPDVEHIARRDAQEKYHSAVADFHEKRAEMDK